MSEGGDESEFLLILEQKPPIWGSGGYGSLSEVFCFEGLEVKIICDFREAFEDRGSDCSHYCEGVNARERVD